MWKNNLLPIFRRLKKHPLFSGINILGLAIGLASCGLIGLYVWKEWTVDRFHERGDRIYRVLSDVQNASGSHVLSSVSRALPKTIEEEVPEVDKVVPISTWKPRIRQEGDYHYKDVRFAGADFFDVFSFPLAEGDAGNVLSEPYTAVITEEMQEQFFGEESAVGKTLAFNDTIPIRITGIAGNPPPSHMDFDVLVSYATLLAMGFSTEEWFTLDQYCYVQLEEQADPVLAAKKIHGLSMSHQPEFFTRIGYRIDHPVENLHDIYLYSGHPSALGNIGDAGRLRMLGLIALFILFIAIVNFINLTTARVGDRSREIGIRKTLGARRGALIRQFLSESMWFALLGGLLGLLLLDLSLPLFNDLTGESISWTHWLQPAYLAAFFAFVLLAGLIAGAYPALLQARLRPVDSFSGDYREGAGGGWLRKGLVIFQFGIAVVLIFSTLTVIRQLRFMQFQDLGFSEEQVLVLDIRQTPRRDLIENMASIQQELQNLPGVETVSGAAALPGRGGWGGQMVGAEGLPEDQALNMEVVPADHHYAELLDLQIVAGRDLDPEMATDAEETVLLNEAAVKAIGWSAEEAVGKTIHTAGRQNGKVVGVVKNYHHHGLQSSVQPMVYFVLPYAYSYFGLRLSGGDYQSSIQRLEAFWQERFPGYPFQYFFLDEDFNSQYQSEVRLSKIFGLFGTLAILTSCMGLLGLAVYTARRRTKEIGVRKVLGASVAQVVALLNREFLTLVGFALLLGLPVAWLLMNRWLEDYALRVTIPWWLFASAGGIAILIALLTVSFHYIKAATANPVEALRDE